MLTLISVALSGCGEQGSKEVSSSKSQVEQKAQTAPQAPKISEADKLKAELAKLDKNGWVEKIYEDKKFYKLAQPAKMLYKFTFADFDKIETKYPELKDELDSWRLTVLKKDKFPDIDGQTVGNLFSNKMKIFGDTGWSSTKDSKGRTLLQFSAILEAEGQRPAEILVKFRYSDENKLEYAVFSKDRGMTIPFPKDMLRMLLSMHAAMDMQNKAMEEVGF